MVPLRRRPDGARRECLPHRYAIAATVLAHPAALLSSHGAYAATPISRFLQRFECRFCCLGVAAACTLALARARPILFFRVPPRFAPRFATLPIPPR